MKKECDAVPAIWKLRFLNAVSFRDGQDYFTSYKVRRLSGCAQRLELGLRFQVRL